MTNTELGLQTGIAAAADVATACPSAHEYKANRATLAILLLDVVGTLLTDVSYPRVKKELSLSGLASGVSRPQSYGAPKNSLSA